MRMETYVIKTPDGVDLFVRSYLPADYNPFKTLYWVHGLGEHGGRQEHVAAALVQQGWRMIVADLRGHGQSTGIPTYVNSFDEYVADIQLIWERLGLADNTATLLGHSMGGLIAIRAVQLRKIVPLTLVVSSPLLGLKLRVNPLTVLLGRILVRFLPTARFANQIDPANLTHDPKFAAMRRNDRLIDKTVTASWYFAMRAALAAANCEADQVTLPVLSLQGSADRTTDPIALDNWFQQVRSSDKKLIVLEGHFHELFFEPDWQPTVDQMLEWLDARIPLIDSKARS